MSNRPGRLIASVAIALPIITGCATNSSQVQQRGALDLDCDAASVSVQLTERPRIGVTHYEASGCGESRFYECRARAYVLGVPMGERTCRRTGNRAGPVVSPKGVVF